MSKLPSQNFTKDVLVGFETSDDAGVFKISEDKALVQTLDFFTPIADDPQVYGQIAAINSLNDIYAMGGVPLTALSIVCYPQNGDWDMLGEIILGGQKALNKENVVVLGGHSVDDQEIKFGYSITGLIDPKKIVRNSGAKAKDLLILTKPLGTGVISTGIKFGKANAESIKESMNAMTKSAREASNIMQKIGANACTDITGFGFLGHAFEMAKSSNVAFVIESESIPLLRGVIELIEQKMVTRGDRNNKTYVGDTIKFAENVTGEMKSALYDPQTAGGLLISMEEEKAHKFLEEYPEGQIIGRVEVFNEYLLNVE